MVGIRSEIFVHNGKQQLESVGNLDKGGMSNWAYKEQGKATDKAPTPYKSVKVLSWTLDP